MDSNFLGSSEGPLDRSNSESDIFAASVRPRTCSNLSLRNKPAKGLKKRPTRDKDLAAQNSLDSESEFGFNAR